MSFVTGSHNIKAGINDQIGMETSQIEAHGDTSVLTFQEATRRFQSRILRDSLDAHNWNVAQVAQRLDLARSHLYTLIRAFGLKRG